MADVNYLHGVAKMLSFGWIGENDDSREHVPTNLRGVAELNPEQQEEVLRFVHLLKLPPGTTGKSLLRFSGTIDAAARAEVEAAIEEGCERIGDEW